MARTKVFDPATALDAAMRVFWQKGYEATSLGDLLHAMGIGRQSMYDTFGDKKQLYLAALDRYIATGAAEMRRRFEGGPSPLALLDDFMTSVADVDEAQRGCGCLAVNAVAEFGCLAPDVARVNEHSEHVTEALFADVLVRAQRLGEIGAHVDPRAAAHFLHNVIRGMRISAKNGATAAQMRATAGFAMAALRAAP